ncbi:MAG: DUF805 domain-containing protein [Bacteroidales bacterium]|nr:DUF805 domain-containing protein [Bacteroidales bacterium]
MNFEEAIKSAFSNYFKFSGRARRSEYWYFYLFNFIVAIVLSIFTITNKDLKILSDIWSLIILFPSLALTVRRLHDIGKSGWYVLLFMLVIILCGFLMFMAGDNDLMVVAAIEILLMLASIIVFIVWMCKDSQPGENKWGPNPKENNSEES